MERVLDKLDNLDSGQQEIKLEIVQIKADLKEHMARTSAVEHTNELLEKKVENSNQVTNTRLGKLEKWYDKFHFLGWLLFAGLGLAEKLDKLRTFFHL